MVVTSEVGLERAGGVEVEELDPGEIGGVVGDDRIVRVIDQLGDGLGHTDVAQTGGCGALLDRAQAIKGVIGVGGEDGLALIGLDLAQSSNSVVEQGLARQGRDATFSIAGVGVAEHYRMSAGLRRRTPSSRSASANLDRRPIGLAVPRVDPGRKVAA